MNNAIYGKTMENLRNNIDVRVVNKEKDYLKCTSKSSYMSHNIFDNKLIAICKDNVALMFNKPAYIGMFILELSKIIMYEFYYDCIKNKCNNKSKLLFTDTDSFMYESKTEDVYEDFSSDIEMFDFSNYLTKSKHYDVSNK